MKNTDLYNEDHEATYCPEDDKLRLYVGHVPRPEYDALRAEGWTCTPKQADGGGCNFSAVWTPSREDTALSYAGEIGDEDQSPADRAADRAERFAGYREKRTGEALQLADRYEGGPTAHGYQSAAVAERRAARHDRIGGHAVTQWEKAEYWQHRTQGVILHALHKSAPGVRMGRIKTIEAEIRRCEAQYTPESEKRYTQDGAEVCICGQGRDRRAVPVDHLESIKASYQRHVDHLTLRLAYENQMLEAQGGRAAFVEMEPGGFIGSRQIQKVNKSPKTGRVVSVEVLEPSRGLNKWGRPDENAPEFWPVLVNIERLKADIYRAPTDEEREAFKAAKVAEKKKRAKNGPKAPPLINPTNKDAERLQALWNERARVYTGSDPYRAQYHADSVKDQAVVYMTQAQYAARSKGSYAVCRTEHLNEGGELYYKSIYGKENGKPCCKIRKTCGSGEYTGNARRVIVLTDKPQKPLPVEVWQ